jgi:hypothetical protein
MAAVRWTMDAIDAVIHDAENLGLRHGREQASDANDDVVDSENDISVLGRLFAKNEDGFRRRVRAELLAKQLKAVRVAIPLSGAHGTGTGARMFY